jgi:uncharacterized phage protein (TIGR01671 family)
MTANRFRFRCYVSKNPEKDRMQFFTLERGAKMFWPVEAPDIVLMQSTGLTDKNGKEIFEGDILEIDKPHPDYENTEKCIVKFGDHLTSNDYYSSCAYGWYADSGGISGETSLAQIGAHQIIGNIYENSELIEALIIKLD